MDLQVRRVLPGQVLRNDFNAASESCKSFAVPGKDAHRDSLDEEPMLCQPCVDDEPNLLGHDEDVDFKLAQLEDPIVGVERNLADEHGAGAIAAKPLPTPPSMTPAAF